MQAKEKKRLAIVAINKEVYAAKLKLDELREKRKEMAADYKGLVRERGMLKEEMLKIPPAEGEPGFASATEQVSRVPDQADGAK